MTHDHQTPTTPRSTLPSSYLSNPRRHPAPPGAFQLTKIWATFNKTAIRNKKLNVRVSLASGAAKSLSAANSTAAASVAQSPARTVVSDSGGAAFASPGSQTSPSGGAARGAYEGGGSRGGVSRAGGIGGAGLDENSRVLANKYDDVSVSCLY